MSDKPMRILLVEDNPIDARVVDAVLTSTGGGEFLLEHVKSLTAALERLAGDPLDVILLDLSLPDANGLESVRRVRAEAPEVAMVVLTGRDDQSIALQAVQHGAQDYLIKTQVEGGLLVRSLRYALERQRLVAQIRMLSLTDELTGLRNRRGFFTLVEQQMRLAGRREEGMVLLLADLDDMKSINDHFGHAEGDQALSDTADVLRHTFRSSDIIGRMGGDEFAVLAIGADPACATLMIERCQRNLDRMNANESRSYLLRMSVGAEFIPPDDDRPLDEVLRFADAAMYERKRLRGAGRDQAAAVGQ